MQVGLVGWRGMVGSVLMQRMSAEKDFDEITPSFFSTSQAGQSAVPMGRAEVVLYDANNLNQLSEMDVIISCQGGDYTKRVHGPLRDQGGRVIG